MTFLDRFDRPYVLAWMLVVVFSICFHEMMHAWTALKNGDDTAARLGHLTMNPLKQMGWVSLIMLVVFGFAWGMVPVNPYALTRRGRFRVSMSGPLSNLGLCVLFSAGAVLAARGALAGAEAGAEGAGPLWKSATLLLLVGAQANGVLFTLNVLPIPGLDGWSALSALVPRFEAWAAQHGQMITWGLFLLLFATNAFTFVFTLGSSVADLFMGGFARLLGLAAG